MTHTELTGIAERWLLKTKGCGFAFKELCAMTGNDEIPDAIGFRSGISILVGCKVSRSDYLSDFKKSFRAEAWLGMGSFRFYMCPEGLIAANELPAKWGLVWVNASGKCKQKVGPKGNCEWGPVSEFYHAEKFEIGERSMMTSALRRLHLRGVLPLIYEDPRKHVKGDVE